jgi:hypothetical protein
MILLRRKFMSLTTKPNGLLSRAALFTGISAAALVAIGYNSSAQAQRGSTDEPKARQAVPLSVTLNEEKRLPNEPAWIASVSDQVRRPESVENALIQAGKSPCLINYHLATEADFSALGLGKCIQIPVQISSSPFGRKSSWMIQKGEVIIDSILLTPDRKILTISTKRLSGNGLANTGDKYEMSISESDRTLYNSTGKFEVISAEKGISRITYSESSSTRKVVIIRSSKLWSCFKKETIIRD